jgi:hypothetical protein
MCPQADAFKLMCDNAGLGGGDVAVAPACAGTVHWNGPTDGYQNIV